MAAGQFTFYNSVAKLGLDGTLDLDSHTFKAILLTSAYAPDAAHDEYADLSGAEVANANGYTTGGVTLTGVTLTLAGGIATFTSNPATWTPSGGAITARYLAIYDDTSANDKAIGYMLLDATPGDVSKSSPTPFTVTPHATDGWFRHIVNP